MSKLSREEREILDAFETGRVRSVPDTERIIQRHRQYAAATSRKDARVNVRLTSRDLRALQKIALAEGIPYQTLISSILHKYAEGRLRDNGRSD